MRKNFGAKPFLYPMPVLILGTYGKDGVPNAMNAAWGGITEDREITVCISADHKTTENIIARRAFTVSIATAETVTACDFFGVVSGNDVPDKVARAGFHATKAKFVDAPYFDELPMALECRLISYDAESCRLVGEIVNVSVDDAVLKEDRRVDPALLRPIAYDPMNHTYLELGAAVGRAFCDGLALKGAEGER